LLSSFEALTHHFRAGPIRQRLGLDRKLRRRLSSAPAHLRPASLPVGPRIISLFFPTCCPRPHSPCPLEPPGSSPSGRRASRLPPPPWPQPYRCVAHHPLRPRRLFLLSWVPRKIRCFCGSGGGGGRSDHAVDSPSLTGIIVIMRGNRSV